MSKLYNSCPHGHIVVDTLSRKFTYMNARKITNNYIMVAFTDYAKCYLVKFLPHRVLEYSADEKNIALVYYIKTYIWMYNININFDPNVHRAYKNSRDRK